MQRDFDVICQGSMCTELLAWVNHYPTGADAVIADPVVWTGGGMAANASQAIATLGGNVALVSVTGDDEFGKKSLDDLNKAGVHTEYILVREGQTSPMVILMVEPSLRRAGLVLGMDKSFELKAEEVPDTILASTKVYLTDISLNEVSVHIALRAKSLGCVVGFDMQMTEAHTEKPGLDENIARLIGITDYFFADQENLLIWTGEQDIQAGCQKMVERYPHKTFVITKGADGAVIVNGKETIEIPAFEVPVIDTVGAGDAFHGAFLLIHVVLGWDLYSAGVFASATAAISCTKSGARNGLPTMNQVKDFLDEKNISVENKKFSLRQVQDT